MELSERFCAAVEQRIEWLTLVLGAAGGAYSGSNWGWRAGVGFALGAGVAWLNFRWLEQGITGLFGSVVPGAESQPKSLSALIYARFFGRLALLVAIVYVILKVAWFPGRAVLAGLFSLIAAVMIEVTYEVATGFREPQPRS